MTSILIGAVIGLALVVAALYWLLWQTRRELELYRKRERQEVSDTSDTPDLEPGPPASRLPPGMGDLNP